jgi:cytochrome c biogenesis protein CcmG/thiol:disulfide interchange protein DsbE
VALLVAACGSTTDAHVDGAAPAIAGTALDGSTVSLADYRGHPVVVNFWASWCTPCREEFPLLKDRLASLGASDGLVVLGVLYKDEADLARSFATDAGATWPTVTDPDGTIAAAYRITAPPQSFFIDKDGVIRAIQIGAMTGDTFDTQYAKIKP